MSHRAKEGRGRHIGCSKLASDLGSFGCKRYAEFDIDIYRCICLPAYMPDGAVGPLSETALDAQAACTCAQGHALPQHCKMGHTENSITFGTIATQKQTWKRVALHLRHVPYLETQSDSCLGSRPRRPANDVITLPWALQASPFVPASSLVRAIEVFSVAVVR